MSYRGNQLLMKLDRLVAFTGVQRRMRLSAEGAAMPLRLSPLLPLAFAILGLFVQARAPLAGWIMIMALWGSAMPLWFTGPMRIPPGGVRDERERALVRTGHLSGLAAVALLAIIGCFAMAALSIFERTGRVRVWLPTGPLDWIAIGFFLLVVQCCVAVLVASWMMPRRLADEDV